MGLNNYSVSGGAYEYSCFKRCTVICEMLSDARKHNIYVAPAPVKTSPQKQELILNWTKNYNTVVKITIL
jgi:hypothetical protein